MYNWENKGVKPTRLHERFMRLFSAVLKRAPDLRDEVYRLMDESTPLAPFEFMLRKISQGPGDDAPTALQPAAALRRP